MLAKRVYSDHATAANTTYFARNLDITYFPTHDEIFKRSHKPMHVLVRISVHICCIYNNGAFVYFDDLHWLRCYVAEN